MDDRTEALRVLAELPLAIEPRALGRMLAIVAGRADPIKAATNGVQVVGSTAIVPIAGPIFRHSSPLFEAFFGATSVDTIRASLRAAVASPAVSNILLAVDSPGGEVAGIADLADEIAGIQKPVTAVADPAMYSAAYYLAAGADTILLPRDAGVGSIGVLAVHVDESALLDKMGLKVTVVKSGARKDQYSSLKPLSDEARASLQARVDQEAQGFYSFVAAQRDLTPDTVRAFEGDTFQGQDAVRVGLADGIGTLEGALQSMQPSSTTRRSGAPKESRMAEDTPPEAPTPTPPTPPPAIAAVVDEKKIADLAQARERKRAGAILTLCTLAGKPQKAAEFVASDMDLEAISDALLKAKVADSGPDVDSAVPVASQKPTLTYAEIYESRRKDVLRANGGRL